jgi:hypothetical protein
MKTRIGTVSIEVLQEYEDTLSNDDGVEPEIASKMFGEILLRLESLFLGEE